MTNTYNLVNPYIEGNVKTSVKSDNSAKAAEKIYETISEHFNNDIPVFFMTVQKGTNGKYYHFQVKETKNKDEVNWSVEPITIKNEVEGVKKFKSKFSKFQTSLSYPRHVRT